MKQLALKVSHHAVTQYYADIGTYTQMGLLTEGTVSPAFAALLRYCANQFKYTLAEKHQVRLANKKRIEFDGAVLTPFTLLHGVWEAKDSQDDLAKEIKRKFEAGYPKDNILFQAPERIIVWQDGKEVFDGDIRKPEKLVEALKLFFEYEAPHIEEWEYAAEAFKDHVKDNGNAILELIRKEYRTNKKFIAAFDHFATLMRESVNPNLAKAAIEEMLVQHLFTERIFRSVFNNPDFAKRNIIAREIETVIDALTSQSFSRTEFLKSLDRFYRAIETSAATIDDFSQKQTFLNTIYERFFQGFSVKVADTHGIVYTPQPVVDFMVRSVADILETEFGRNLSDPGVHILDPFVGTGNFILRIMREIQKSRLPQKYANELHCNEVMLLPYYIASLNIEHEFLELTGQYEPFEGIALVDTFELAESRQPSLFSQENTERIERQKRSPIFVIVGNPPYNVGQLNENDNNKNRSYPEIDRQVRETYAKDSKATNKNALDDVYVKAIRWASRRIGEEGIVAFITNSGFISNLAFDGMRKHLANDFDGLYILDLGGDVRTNPKISGTTHNVFGIQVGVSINLMIRSKALSKRGIYYARLDEFWRRGQKYEYLDNVQHWRNVAWGEITPDAKYTWLTEGLHADFDTFLPIGTKEAKAGREQAIFDTYSNGVKTNRDTWAYNFQRDQLEQNIQRMIDTYNEHVFRWQRLPTKPNVDDFVNNDETKISWSRDLKLDLQRGRFAEFASPKIRHSLYRPFARCYLFFDGILNEEVYQFPNFFPKSEAENLVICVTDKGSEKPFMVLMTDQITDLHLVGAGSSTQCFPFYIYDEDGTNRRENITDWALAQFQGHYGDATMTKWDIFHYVYALLHHPAYRETFAANLKRELPRIPFVTGFWEYVKAGRRLAELHVEYEKQPEYRLQRRENRKGKLDWRVEKLWLSRDGTTLVYNDFLTLHGIPAEALEYKLGNKSALHWVIDQYQITTDKRSGIVNDPNRLDDPEYILRLVGQVITVSVETVAIVKGLPEWVVE